MCFRNELSSLAEVSLCGNLWSEEREILGETCEHTALVSRLLCVCVCVFYRNLPNALLELRFHIFVLTTFAWLA